MKFSDYLIGNQGGQPMSSQVQTPIQPQQMQSIAPQQSMQSSVTDFGIKPNQSAPKKKAETFDVLGMLEKTNQFTQQAIKDNPAPVKREYSGRDKNIIEVKKGIEDSLRETHKLNTLLDMKKYVDDGATFEEVQQDFQDIPQEVIGQIYDELANKSKLSTILKMYPELDNIQPPKELSDKYSLQKDNALKQAGQFILDAKERSKEKGDISSNFLTQGFMGAVGGAVKGVGDLIQGGGGLVDKGIAGTQALIQGGEMEDYQALPNSTAEDLLDTASGATSSLGALYAMPASILINSGIEALPEEGQRALSDSMDWLGDKIAKIPGLAQWMQSLPPERQSQFKQELAGAGVALLIGLKNKKNIITDPKTFLRENINPVAIAKNFNENVLGVPKAAGKLVEGAVNEAGNKISTTVKGAKGKLSTMTRGATDYAAKKLIDSKFKLTKTNKDAIRKSAGVEPSEFILENNIGGNNIDEMVENTKSMVDDAMQTKFQALSEVKELQPITQREKLIGQSIVKQAKGDIEEIYGKKFDEILDDEIVPELKEQFTIVKNIEKVINEKEISPLQLEALKSLYDIYNSHLKYDLTKKRVLGAAEKIRLGLQETIEGLGEQVGVDIKGLNKKIAGGKALEKGLIQAGDRLDNNNLFGLSDSQTAILSSALGGGGLEVASVLGVKSLFENIGLRNKLARSLYTKKTPNVGPKIPNNTSSVGTTARSNISKQFGDSDTIVNGSKPNIQVKTKGLSNLKDQGDMPKIPAKTPKELPAKQNIADTTPTTVKKKPVQSDTLVSKADEMESERLANLDYENNMSNPEKIQSIAIGKEKQFKEFMKKLSKEGKVNPFTLESDIKMVKEGVLGEKASKNILEERDKYISRVDNVKAPKELQPLYDEAKKYKSADEFIRAQDTIYHGSPYKFDEFNTDNVGKSVGSDKEGIFFTNSETLAGRYTYDPSKNIRGGIINATVNIKNPLEIEVKQTPLSYFTSNKEKIIKKAKKGGYDGIKIYDKLGDENIIISLDPNNIKTESQLRKIREEANK